MLPSTGIDLASAPHPRFRDVIRNGIHSRCPRCGQGQLFGRWIKVVDRCSACGLLYQRDSGDTWMFIVLTDRIPVLAGIAAVYFGVRSTTFFASFLFFLALAVPLLATLRARIGLAVALNYLSRIYLPD